MNWLSSFAAKLGFAAAGVFFLVPGYSFATENGDTNWPLGVQTVVPAILPPPGATEFYSYTVYYKADSFKGGDGKSAIPGFGLENFVQALRVVHTWNYQTESGAKFSSGIIGSTNHVKVDAFGMSDEDAGLKQLYVTPLYITYSPAENLHLLTGFSAFLPFGDYNKKDLANNSSNYATYTQEFAATWFPNKSWEVSIAPTISFNAENTDTNYRSGNVLNVDYLLGYRFESNPKIQVGLAGYYTKQFSDDERDGREVADGNRLEKFAIGPQLFYSFDEASGVVVKWLHETSVEYGPKGDSVWVEFAFPL